MKRLFTVFLSVSLLFIGSKGGYAQQPLPDPPPPTDVNGADSDTYQKRDIPFDSTGHMSIEIWTHTSPCTDSIYVTSQARLEIQPTRGNDVEEVSLQLPNPDPSWCKLKKFEPLAPSPGIYLGGSIEMAGSFEMNLSTLEAAEGIEVIAAKETANDSVRFTVDYPDLSVVAANTNTVDFFAQWSCPCSGAQSLQDLSHLGYVVVLEIDDWGENTYYSFSGTSYDAWETFSGPIDTEDTATTSRLLLDTFENPGLRAGEDYFVRARLRAEEDLLADAEVTLLSGGEETPMEPLNELASTSEESLPGIEYGGWVTVPEAGEEGSWVPSAVGHLRDGTELLAEGHPISVIRTLQEGETVELKQGRNVVELRGRPDSLFRVTVESEDIHLVGTFFGDDDGRSPQPLLGPTQVGVHRLDGQLLQIDLLQEEPATLSSEAAPSP
ncbi:MAG: hypothetical protein K0U98_24905 [Deltaproteobacteria bacterium]|nr:hypothetical protein [Deltaproteobacteria bacterium]